MLKYNLILIEDEEIDRELIKELISKELNCNIIEFSDGENALNYIENNKVDCIIIDFVLPTGRSGLEILNEIRKIDQKVPIIFLTNYGTEEVAVKALQSGASDYIIKNRLFKEPSYISQLNQKIISLIKEYHSYNIPDILQNRLDLMLKLSDEVILRIDINGNLTLLNQNIFKKLGFSKNEIDNEASFYDFIHPKDVHKTKLAIESIFKQGSIIKHFEVRLLTKDGDYKEFLWSGSPEFDKNNRIVGAFIIGKDISEEKVIKKEIDALDIKLKFFNEFIENVKNNPSCYKKNLLCKYLNKLIKIFELLAVGVFREENNKVHCISFSTKKNIDSTFFKKVLPPNFISLIKKKKILIYSKYDKKLTFIKDIIGENLSYGLFQALYDFKDFKGFVAYFSDKNFKKQKANLQFFRLFSNILITFKLF